MINMTENTSNTANQGGITSLISQIVSQYQSQNAPSYKFHREKSPYSFSKFTGTKTQPTETSKNKKSKTVYSGGGGVITGAKTVTGEPYTTPKPSEKPVQEPKTVIGKALRMASPEMIASKEELLLAEKVKKEAEKQLPSKTELAEKIKQDILSQAKGEKGTIQVTIGGTTYFARNKADVERISEKIAEQELKKARVELSYSASEKVLEQVQKLKAKTLTPKGLKELGFTEEQVRMVEEGELTPEVVVSEKGVSVELKPTRKKKNAYESFLEKWGKGEALVLSNLGLQKSEFHPVKIQAGGMMEEMTRAEIEWKKQHGIYQPEYSEEEIKMLAKRKAYETREFGKSFMKGALLGLPDFIISTPYVITHPKETVEGMVEEYKENPAYFTGELVGGAFAFRSLGKLKAKIKPPKPRIEIKLTGKAKTPMKRILQYFGKEKDYGVKIKAKSLGLGEIKTKTGTYYVIEQAHVKGAGVLKKISDMKTTITGARLKTKYAVFKKPKPTMLQKILKRQPKVKKIGEAKVKAGVGAEAIILKETEVKPRLVKRILAGTRRVKRLKPVEQIDFSQAFKWLESGGIEVGKPKPKTGAWFEAIQKSLTTKTKVFTKGFSRGLKEKGITASMGRVRLKPKPKASLPKPKPLKPSPLAKVMREFTGAKAIWEKKPAVKPAKTKPLPKTPKTQATITTTRPAIKSTTMPLMMEKILPELEVTITEPPATAPAVPFMTPKIRQPSKIGISNKITPFEMPAVKTGKISIQHPLKAEKTKLLTATGEKKAKKTRTRTEESQKPAELTGVQPTQEIGVGLKTRQELKIGLTMKAKVKPIKIQIPSPPEIGITETPLAPIIPKRTGKPKKKTKKAKKRVKKTRVGYLPSMTAVAFNIRGKMPKMLTGLEVKPIPLQKPKKRKMEG